MAARKRQGPGHSQPHGWPKQPPMGSRKHSGGDLSPSAGQAPATTRHEPAAAVLTVARWPKAAEKK